MQNALSYLTAWHTELLEMDMPTAHERLLMEELWDRILNLRTDSSSVS